MFPYGGGGARLMHVVGFVWWLAQWPLILLGMSMFAGMANTVNDGCTVGEEKAPKGAFLCGAIPAHQLDVAFYNAEFLAAADLVRRQIDTVNVRAYFDRVSVRA